jgi:hypothetical protein
VRAKLLDEIQIHLVALQLGKGTRLFENLDAIPFQLELVSAVRKEEVVLISYRFSQQWLPAADRSPIR